MAKRIITVVRRGRIVTGTNMQGIADELNIHRGTIVRMVQMAEENHNIFWGRWCDLFITDKFIKGKSRGKMGFGFRERKKVKT